MTRRFLVPEVVQTSSMDCGPACLQCLLAGFGIEASYGRLREACQTSLDGTSISTIAEAASRLGLEAEEVMIPVDHLFLAESAALPAIVVVRRPLGTTHFVLLWRTHGRIVQLMDPGVGRQWVAAARFRREIYVHTLAVGAEDWRAWASGEQGATALGRRLGALGAGPRLLEETLAGTEDWLPLAALDASVRLTAALVEAGAVRRGRPAAGLLAAFHARARVEGPVPDGAVPPAYWSARPGPEDGTVLFSGAVLVRVGGRREADEGEAEELPIELAAAIRERPERPAARLAALLREDGLLAPSVLLASLLVAAIGVGVEAVLFRGLFDLSARAPLPDQRMGALAAVAAFLAGLLAIEAGAVAGLLRAGRRLETRLRMAFLEKLPKMADRYFGSRPISDMAERSHSIHTLRTLPDVGRQMIGATFSLLATLAGIAWLDPAGAPVASLAAGLAFALPVLAGKTLSERDLRVRIHGGALGRFHLDALLGLVPIRTHGAETAVRREHDGLLAEWRRAGLALVGAASAVEAASAAIGFALSAWLLLDHLGRSGHTAGVLLLAYWGLQIPVYGREIVSAVRQYPMSRNTTLRLVEPLGAVEDSPAAATPADGVPGSGAVGLVLEGVSVKAGGHEILREVDLEIPAGAHVAVVGESGAGKSSLLGLFLGWHRPSSGRVLAGGRPLEGAALESLRLRTAWVDPAVHLWNRSLLENLRYGTPRAPGAAIRTALEQADLIGLLERLPEGQSTPLGEGGGLLSGGEGQRVRLARAMIRTGVGLALLDEPFRGLDRERRSALLARARRLWGEATLLCVTHDIASTLGFDRVLVVSGGRIVEDGPPAELRAREDSRYRSLLDAEEEVRRTMWEGPGWRRLGLRDGRLEEPVDA